MTRTIATTEKDSDSSASVRSRTKGVVDERRLQRYVDEAECGLGAREFSAEYCDQGSAIEPRPHLHHRCVIRLVEIVHGRRDRSRMLVYFASPATPIMSCATRVTPPSNQLYEAGQAQASSEQDHEAECHLRGTSGRNRPTRAVCFPALDSARRLVRRPTHGVRGRVRTRR
jgi:hypothetical protein